MIGFLWLILAVIVELEAIADIDAGVVVLRCREVDTIALNLFLVG